MTEVEMLTVALAEEQAANAALRALIERLRRIIKLLESERGGEPIALDLAEPAD